MCCHERAAGQGEWPDYALAAHGALQPPAALATNEQKNAMDDRKKMMLSPRREDAKEDSLNLSEFFLARLASWREYSYQLVRSRQNLSAPRSITVRPSRSLQ